MSNRFKMIKTLVDDDFGDRALGSNLLTMGELLALNGTLFKVGKVGKNKTLSFIGNMNDLLARSGNPNELVEYWQIQDNSLQYEGMSLSCDIYIGSHSRDTDNTVTPTFESFTITCPSGATAQSGDSFGFYDTASPADNAPYNHVGTYLQAGLEKRTITCPTGAAADQGDYVVTPKLMAPTNYPFAIWLAVDGDTTMPTGAAWMANIVNSDPATFPADSGPANPILGGTQAIQLVDFPAASAIGHGDYFVWESIGGEKIATWFAKDGNTTPPTGAAFAACSGSVRIDILSTWSEQELTYRTLKQYPVGNVPYGEFHSQLVVGGPLNGKAWLTDIHNAVNPLFQSPLGLGWRITSTFNAGSDKLVYTPPVGGPIDDITVHNADDSGPGSLTAVTRLPGIAGVSSGATFAKVDILSTDTAAQVAAKILAAPVLGLVATFQALAFDDTEAYLDVQKMCSGQNLQFANIGAGYDPGTLVDNLDGTLSLSYSNPTNQEDWVAHNANDSGNGSFNIATIQGSENIPPTNAIMQDILSNQIPVTTIITPSDTAIQVAEKVFNTLMFGGNYDFTAVFQALLNWDAVLNGDGSITFTAKNTKGSRTDVARSNGDGTGNGSFGLSITQGTGYDLAFRQELYEFKFGSMALRIVGGSGFDSFQPGNLRAYLSPVQVDISAVDRRQTAAIPRNKWVHIRIDWNYRLNKWKATIITDGGKRKISQSNLDFLLAPGNTRLAEEIFTRVSLFNNDTAGLTTNVAFHLDNVLLVTNQVSSGRIDDDRDDEDDDED